MVWTGTPPFWVLALVKHFHVDLRHIHNVESSFSFRFPFWFTENQFLFNSWPVHVCLHNLRIFTGKRHKLVLHRNSTVHLSCMKNKWKKNVCELFQPPVDAVSGSPLYTMRTIVFNVDSAMSREVKRCMMSVEWDDGRCIHRVIWHIHMQTCLGIPCLLCQTHTHFVGMAKDRPTASGTYGPRVGSTNKIGLRKSNKPSQLLKDQCASEIP